MKPPAVILLLVCCLPAFAAEMPKPFRTIRLDAVRHDPGGCDRKWAVWPDRLIWIDENNMVAQLYDLCNNPDPKTRKIQSMLAVFDTNGHSRSRDDPTTSIARGPAGTVLVGHGSEIAIMDKELRMRRTLACPAGPGSRLIFTPWALSASFDFALCPSTELEENCFFYRRIDKLAGKKLNSVASNVVVEGPMKNWFRRTTDPFAPRHDPHGGWGRMNSGISIIAAC